MASDVEIDPPPPPYLPSLLLRTWDSLSPFWFAPGALATAADALLRSQQSFQLRSTWELILFFIFLSPPFFYLDNDVSSFSSSIPVTHLMSDGPSSSLPRHEFTLAFILVSGCLVPHPFDSSSVRMLFKLLCQSQGVFSQGCCVYWIRDYCSYELWPVYKFGYVGWWECWISVIATILFLQLIWIDSPPPSPHQEVLHNRRASLILPPLEFTASAHAIYTLSVRNAKSGIGPDPTRIQAVLCREVSLNFGSAGCRGIWWMHGKCVEIFNCICSGFSPVTGSQRDTLMVGVH